MRWPACLLAASLAACGGGGSSSRNDTVTITPPPEPVTRAVLAGPLCTPERCECRNANAPGDGGAGVPDDGSKRFEFHVGPAENGLWVSVDDNVLYKSDERAEDCFYVDLRPGQHKMVLRANRGGGFSAAVDVHEYGATAQSWYDTFSFSCGAPGTCSYDALDEWKASLAQFPRGLHDACGSTKIKNVNWDAGRAADQLHPQDLQLELVLDVYKFAPEHPTGDPACAGRTAE